jgi:hypothetical protein
VTDSIPYAQEETDINMQLETRQRRASGERAKGEEDGTRWRKEGTGNVMEETRHGSIVQLAGFGQRQVQF